MLILLISSSLSINGIKVIGLKVARNKHPSFFGIHFTSSYCQYTGITPRTMLHLSFLIVHSQILVEINVEKLYLK